MKFKTYKNTNGGTSIISVENAFVEIKELGHMFAVALAERGHNTKESNLMSGLAAYHLLNLKGENARCDAAHDLVVGVVTDEMFKRARAA